jgi:hypothetical protein
MAATGMHTTMEELLGTMFSVRPTPRLYNEGQMPLEISGREHQGAWRQDDLIGGKPPVVK